MYEFTGRTIATTPTVYLPFPVVIRTPMDPESPRARGVLTEALNAARYAFPFDHDTTARHYALRAMREAMTGNVYVAEDFARTAACALGAECWKTGDGPCHVHETDQSSRNSDRRLPVSRAVVAHRWPMVHRGYALIPFPLLVARPATPDSLIESARLVYPGHEYAQQLSAEAAREAWSGDVDMAHRLAGDAAQAAGHSRELVSSIVERSGVLAFA